MLLPPQSYVAVARKLAVIVHLMWGDRTFYLGDSTTNRNDAVARIVDCWEHIDEWRGRSSNA